MTRRRGRHARSRAAVGAVFVDDTGRRGRWAHVALRTFFLLCLVGLGLVLVSLLGGVPLPGLTDPVRLPSGEGAHPRGVHPNAGTQYGIGSGVATTAPGGPPPASAVSGHAGQPGGSTSAAAAGSTTAAATTASPTPSSPRHTTPPPAISTSHSPPRSNARHTPTPHNTKPHRAAGTPLAPAVFS